MEKSYEFLNRVLDSLTEHIVVVDKTGKIQFVNKSWSDFGINNACIVGDGWVGVNYIEECDKAAAMGDEFGTRAGNGIKSVINMQENIFYLEYPCHSPDEKRWFMMRVTPFQVAAESYYVISHQNISERKLAENEVKRLATMDGLTGIPNRRAFDEFLDKEWKRCRRLKKPICLAILDIDNFKLINNNHGHQFGDECLIKVGELLEGFAKRPGDICARYGGEEFALVWSDTKLEQAKKLTNKLLCTIADHKIPNGKSDAVTYLTVSIGLAEQVPAMVSKERDIIGIADHMLYRAKERGKNRVEYWDNALLGGG
ncbi:MAG: diguanylate cyclase [Candidatus Thiodiazotropha sp.]